MEVPRSVLIVATVIFVALIAFAGYLNLAFYFPNLPIPELDHNAWSLFDLLWYGTFILFFISAWGSSKQEDRGERRRT
jgi:hypothetical protein